MWTLWTICFCMVHIVHMQWRGFLTWAKCGQSSVSTDIGAVRYRKITPLYVYTVYVIFYYLQIYIVHIVHKPRFPYDSAWTTLRLFRYPHTAHIVHIKNNLTHNCKVM